MRRAGTGAAAATLLSLLAALAPTSSACTILGVSDGDVVLMGNNEDESRPGMIWFVPPGEGRLGRVNVGFDKRLAQGGMNSRGLAFDAAALAEVLWVEDPSKPTPDNLLETIMDGCASVAEAIEHFERYNGRHLADSQFFFADATGDSAVIAWLADSGLSVVRRSGPWQVVANWRLEQSGYRGPRFVRSRAGAVEVRPPATLFPEGDLAFRIAPDRGRVVFRIDRAGRVVALTLQKGRDVHASRVEPSHP